MYGEIIIVCCLVVFRSGSRRRGPKLNRLSEKKEQRTARGCEHERPRKTIQTLKRKRKDDKKKVLRKHPSTVNMTGIFHFSIEVNHYKEKTFYVCLQFTVKSCKDAYKNSRVTGIFQPLSLHKT